MKKDLIIVESPTKIKTIKKLLKNKYEITATKGHIKDLPKKTIGIDTEKDFKIKYVTVKGRKKEIDDIKSKAKKSENILIATDPDREGESIAYHVYEIVKKITKEDKIKRIILNEITKKAIEKALSEPEEIDINKVNAQQARRALDRLVGYKISPVLWKNVKSKLSAGRVQSVALKLICDREEEINKFISNPYFLIKALLEKEENKIEALLVNEKNKEVHIKEKKEADEICKRLKKCDFIVDKIKQTKKKGRPLPPFITSTLQQESFNLFKFSPKKTMMIAQQLYEGIDIEKERIGLITYMRTDSFRLSADAVNAAREYIKQNLGEKYLPSKPIFYKNKKKIQDAHEAIRPSLLDKAPDKIKEYLTNDQYKIYSLIYKRFIACQANVPEFKIVTLEILPQGHKEKFLAKLRKCVFDGYYKILKRKTKDDEIIDLKVQDKLKLNKLSAEEKIPQPPARYTQGSLVKTLEDAGIGRPSTYAAVVSTIVARAYVLLKEGKFFPTKIGLIVNELLQQNFERLFNTNFTAEMEETLDKIETGEGRYVETLKQFYTNLEELLEKGKKDIKSLKHKLIEKTDKKCEVCGADMIIRYGVNGRFLACETFPKCKNTKDIKIKEDGKIEIVTFDEKCEVCGADLVLKIGRFGKFLACSKYPECKFTRTIGTRIKCPDCGKEIQVRYSKKKRKYYTCNNKECKFVLFYSPIEKKCPKCGSEIMVKQGKNYVCINKECKHKILIEDEE